MPLALIVEDGSNVTNANSYATLQEIRDFNTLRGVKLPDDDDAVIALSSQAMDYLAVYESRLAGRRTYGPMQPLSYPRANLIVFGMKLPTTFIPREIREVQCLLVGIATTIDLSGNKDTAAVTRDTLGPITTEYAADKGATTGPILPTVTAKMQPFLRSGAGMIRSVRV